MKLGDIEKANEYLLTDFDDKSKYRSAQGYNDNIICICFESSYKFYQKVFDEVKSIYDKSNIKLDKFSIVADEVPYGAWQKSKVCLVKATFALLSFAAEIASDKSLCINFEEKPALKSLSTGLIGPTFLTGQ